MRGWRWCSITSMMVQHGGCMLQSCGCPLVLCPGIQHAGQTHTSRPPLTSSVG